MSGSRDNRNRRIIKYNFLKQEIEDLTQNTSELTVEIASKAHKLWKEVNKVPLDGAEADELLLSVQINEAITQFFNNAYPKFEVSDTLTTELFVSKLKENVERVGWEEALKPFDFLRDSISFQTLNQPQVPQVINIVNKERRQNNKDKEIASIATQPTQVATADYEANEKVHLDSLDKELLRLYQTTKKPIEFWSFVMDQNFENTVERMFYVNNLVNDNKIKLLIDDDNEKYLKPVKGSERNQSIDSSKKVQMFMSISPDEHMELLEKQSSIITKNNNSQKRNSSYMNLMHQKVRKQN